ncbi:MAG TPA: chemotaxis protein CheA [Opitutaceae bacterium]|jgi:two-component system chemotaxis sensor kinase CheA|nr:chemotaxis protein CheA [Opitutaceae bacterium]
MPIPPDDFPNIEDALNRLATESILAQPGRDEGMVPAYSLLGDMAGLCAGEPRIQGPILALQARLEKALDASAPFTAEMIAALRELSTWMVAALGDVKSGLEARSYSSMAEDRGDEGKVIQMPAPAAAAPAVPDDAKMVLSLEGNQELLGEFYSEAVEHLQQIEASLLALDSSPSDPEAINAIFRSFHTIKGNAGFLGLVPMHTLAHEVESLLDLARNNKLSLSSAIISEILRSRDALQSLTLQIGTALDSGQEPTEIVKVGHLILAVRRLASGETPPAAAVVTAAPFPIELPVAVPAPKVEEEEEEETPVKTAAKGQGASPTVRVSTEKLDSLMDVVGELVIVQSQLLETARADTDSTSPLQRNVTQLSRITKELQHTAMSLRMIPIKPTFQKMERLVRDLARDCHKAVNFKTSGDETELDRTVVEEIADPLVHMVRNAVDHGLERANDRVKTGKAAAGTIRLKAYHQGSHLVIELQDDGRGMDPDKIFAKAVEKGIIPANAALSREQILDLIFAPGFSTAEKVTAISGRGVGMDVVRRNIQKLRGKIEISSELGVGSTFKVKLPLTMAIIDGLVVRVGDDRFILPSTSVQMALKPSREMISSVHGKGEVLDLRGKLLPIHRLHRRFNIQGRSESPWDGILVIMEVSGKLSALLVDEMVSKQEVVIKNLGGYMQGLPGIAGGAILGDGNIALILDPGTLLQAA